VLTSDVWFSIISTVRGTKHRTNKDHNLHISWWFSSGKHAEHQKRN